MSISEIIDEVATKIIFLADKSEIFETKKEEMKNRSLELLFELQRRADQYWGT